MVNRLAVKDPSPEEIKAIEDAVATLNGVWCFDGNISHGKNLTKRTDHHPDIFLDWDNVICRCWPNLKDCTYLSTKYFIKRLKILFNGKRRRLGGEAL